MVRQPQLFYEVSELYSQATSKRDKAKQVLEQGAATIAQHFRSSSSPNKVTAAEVEQHITGHPEYVAQYHRYLDFKYEAELLEGLKNAYAQRSSMLRDLVSLFNTGYWGTGINVNERMIKTYSEKYGARGKSQDE